MKTTKGFQIKKRVTRFIHRIDMHRWMPSSGPGSGLLGWVKRKAKGLLKGRRTRSAGYMKLGRVHKMDRPGVPKGHLAVHVGQKEGEFCRVLVPVFYFNHPLFGRLLSEAEEKFGFYYPGRITIPCPISEFESVTTKIERMPR